jgi:hypothetical protein
MTWHAIVLVVCKDAAMRRGRDDSVLLHRGNNKLIEMKEECSSEISWFATGFYPEQ